MAEFIKTIPQNIEAEKAVLGSILMDNRSYQQGSREKLV